MFWENLKMWMAENIAKHLNDNATIPSILTVQQLWEQAQDTLAQVLAKKGIPDLTFGDALSGALHDADNEEGVDAAVGADKVKLVGDGEVLDEKGRDLVKGVDTMRKAVAGVKVSLQDLHDSNAAGRSAPSVAFDPDTVLGRLRTPDGLFKAEQLWPRALPDSSPDQSNKSLPWQVATTEALFADARMRAAIVLFSHNKADALAGAVDMDPPFKEAKTAAFQQSVIAKLKGDENSVISAFRAIINYTPGSATISRGSPHGELGGIGDHDRDDNAVDYYKKAKEKGALGTLTQTQRTKLLVDVLDGVTIGNEVTMILDLLTSASTQLTPVLDAVGWVRVYGKLWGDDCRRLIRECGPAYWAAAPYERKRAEVKRLADGRTNDIDQEAIVVILRTCTPDEVRRIDREVGGRLGLSWDLDGRWNRELKAMEATR
jgi:hypothetical protein